ncbi:unnamed protein product [Rotaria sp. Silwood1]|nr:unnamed protein product [Rotaria sp. Silwood1]CAF1620577.1 unnamed protein product [Rotaria sp. Silwood1]CAF3757921.1 unnamed protein product [Rotaria sp. Silwood1]CAF4693468.1 unnamed protein product [Rotaria sp. Silwood1]
MSTYKLYYFNTRGRAEIARLIFAAAGQQYDDIRYERSEWPSHKAEMPLGQIPVLEFNGVKLPQSIAIARFLAKQFHLAGKDNLEEAKVDAVVDTVGDLAIKYMSFRREEDTIKKQEALKHMLAEVPKHFTNLETLAKMYNDGGSFFVGNQLTWADLCVYEMIDILLSLNDHVLADYSWLKRNREEVEKQPNIATYVKSRPPSKN